MSLSGRIRAAENVFIIGNGGSYANAMHVANDLISVGVRAHILDPSTLTAIANDYGYEHVFSRWLQVFARRGDLLIALSGSGKSKNILNAVEVAGKIGMDVEKIFGAPALGMQQAEEYQVWLGHELRRQLSK